MSPLDPAKIRELQAKNAAKKAGRVTVGTSKTGRRKTSKHDPNDRSYKAWFALEHHLLDDSDKPVYCDNPDCIDTRPKERGQVVAELPDGSGRKLCRVCYVEGWLLANPAQLSVSDAATSTATSTDAAA